MFILCSSKTGIHLARCYTHTDPSCGLLLSSYSALVISLVYFRLTRQTHSQPYPNHTRPRAPSKPLTPPRRNSDKMVFQMVTPSPPISIIIAMEKFVLLPCSVTTGKGLGLGVSPRILTIAICWKCDEKPCCRNSINSIICHSRYCRRHKTPRTERMSSDSKLETDGYWRRRRRRHRRHKR